LGLAVAPLALVSVVRLLDYRRAIDPAASAVVSTAIN